MGRHRVFCEWDVPRSVVNIVRSVCADYDRRKTEIERAQMSDIVLKVYADINATVDRAMEEIEVSIREALLFDIAYGRGYDVCAASSYLSNNAYYRRKRKAVHDIAVGLHLI